MKRKIISIVLVFVILTQCLTQIVFSQGVKIPKLNSTFTINSDGSAQQQEELPTTSDEQSQENVILPTTSDEQSQENVILPPTSDEQSQENVILPPTSDEQSQGNVILPPTSDEQSQGNVILPPTSDEQSQGNVILPPFQPNTEQLPQTCKHYNYEDIYSYSSDWEYYNNSTHRITHYFNRFCSDCGIKLDTVTNTQEDVHNWIKVDEYTHKCSVCEKTEYHTKDGDKCYKCNASYIKYDGTNSTVGYVNVYNHDVVQLMNKKRLYVTDEYGNIYKRVLLENGDYDDKYISVNASFKANSVYISGDPDNENEKLKLYINLENGDYYYSQIPEEIVKKYTEKENEQVIKQEQDVTQEQDIEKEKLFQQNLEKGKKFLQNAVKYIGDKAIEYATENSKNKKTTYPDLYKNGYYDREAVVAYATNPDYSSTDKNGDSFLNIQKHTRKYNQEYERYDNINYYLQGHSSGSDCANFVSQSLYAGGVKQTENFYFKWNVLEMTIITARQAKASEAWIRVGAQLEYLKDQGYINGNILIIKSVSDMQNAVRNLGAQKGDILFLMNDKEGVHHSMILTGIQADGTILFSAHSNDRINEPISEELLKNDTLLIVRMK